MTEIVDRKFSKLTGFLKLHGEWASLMATLLACFSFVLHQTVQTNDRLDRHMQEIHTRVDTANQRSDTLHQEYFELLKEMRNK